MISFRNTFKRVIRVNTFVFLNLLSNDETSVRQIALVLFSPELLFDL